MSDAKHTPGPWTYDGIYHDPIVYAGTKRKKKPVIELDSDGGCGDPECCGPASYHISVSDEDGHLIAAAPDLLEALRGLIKAIEQSPNLSASLEYDIADELVAARAALSKSQAPAAAGDRTTGEPPAPSSPPTAKGET